MSHLASKEHKYRFLLSGIILFILLSSVLTENLLGRIATSLLFVLVVISTLKLIKVTLNAYLILIPVVIVALVSGIGNQELYYLRWISKASVLLFFLSVIYFFGRNIFFNQQLDSDRVYGAICIYLFIGIAYAYIYMIINLIHPPALFYQYDSSPVINTFDYYYFSFITITTVGFGDIIPTNNLGRAFVMLEGITGLFYLALLVANMSTMLKDLFARNSTS